MTELNWIQIQKKPIKDMRKLPLKLEGSKHIRDDNGLTFYSVTGNQQSGKSAYGMNILSELYEFNEDAIMNQIVMTAKEFADKIDDALTNKYRHRCIMWDDASVTGSAAKWMTDPKMVMYLAALGDTLAVATKSIILTSPSGDMVKAFRNYQKYIIQIGLGKHRNDRIARAYFIGKSPMMQRWCRTAFEDPFDVKIPFYLRYAKKREDLSLKAVRDMKIMFSEQNTKEPENIAKNESSWFERCVVNMWERGITNLSEIARQVKNTTGMDADHKKVSRVLEKLNLRDVYV